MRHQNPPKISVVVPCFNEEQTIATCLRALEKQTVKLHEIIVVDNNCTDNTASVAASFVGVKILQEPVQGLKPARNAGMNAASGDIIARIDADSRVAPNWAETIAKTMANPKVQAVTGTGYFYDAPCKKLVRSFRNVFAVWLNRLVLRHHMLWGSNMAVRASVWRTVVNDCCALADIMEDLDIAMHIHSHFDAKAIAYRPRMRADISARRAMVSAPQNWRYLKMWPYTLSLHNRPRRVMLWPAF